LFAALGAGHGYFNPLPDAGHLGRRDCRQSIILGLFAGFTSLRFIVQAFVVKEDLLAGSPNEWLAAIDAGDRSILKSRRLVSFDRLRLAV
jgi:hypothetical protein